MACYVTSQRENNANSKIKFFTDSPFYLANVNENVIGIV